MTASLNALVPEIRDAAQELIQVAVEARLQPRVTSTLRSHAEQTKLYRSYLRGERTLPVAPPGTSAHEYGWAFDLVVSPLSELKNLGSLWTSWGGWYGGRGDPVHFQLPGNPTPTGHKAGFFTRALAGAADFLIARYPAIGAVELASSLLSMGFPDNQVYAFLSGPFTYLVNQ